jgi:tRNA pseudouridine38-40 synthase
MMDSLIPDMSRYFLEVAYKGTHYAGFQIQDNAVTIQGEIDKALSLLLREPVKTTGSSRTDTGVHAYQNYLHFDSNQPLLPHLRYKLNAVLSPDIVIRAIYAVGEDAHARFGALSRSYLYRVYNAKDPFLRETGYYFPYPLEADVLHRTAAAILEYTDFTSFSKRNTQVKTFNCQIQHASWEKLPGQYLFHITANRFLRGMVRGLVGTMLKTARGRLDTADFRRIIEARINLETDFSAPPQGLFLMEVKYPEGLLNRPLPG